MCGIAAIIGDNKQDSKILKKMLLPILHRGEKKYFNESIHFGKCVLGMNRLVVGTPKTRHSVCSMIF